MKNCEGQIKKIPVFRVTRPYLNLLVKPRFFSGFMEKNIILCILKGELQSSKCYQFVKKLFSWYQIVLKELLLLKSLCQFCFVVSAAINVQIMKPVQSLHRFHNLYSSCIRLRLKETVQKSSHC